MGCCESRASSPSIEKLVCSYVEICNLDNITCSCIKRLQVQLTDTYLTLETYNDFVKSSDIKAPFSLLAKGNSIQKQELVYALLLFSSDTFDNKRKLFEEEVAKSSRRLMHFLELKYQLLYERIPQELTKLNIIKSPKEKEYSDRMRLKAGNGVFNSFQRATENPNPIEYAAILSI